MRVIPKMKIERMCNCCGITSDDCVPQIETGFFIKIKEFFFPDFNTYTYGSKFLCKICDRDKKINDALKSNHGKRGTKMPNVSLRFTWGKMSPPIKTKTSSLFKEGDIVIATKDSQEMPKDSVLFTKHGIERAYRRGDSYKVYRSVSTNEFLDIRGFEKRGENILMIYHPILKDPISVNSDNFVSSAKWREMQINKILGEND